MMTTIMMIIAVALIFLAFIQYDDYSKHMVMPLFFASLSLFIMLWIFVAAWSVGYTTIHVKLKTENDGFRFTQYAYWGDKDSEKINITKETGCFYAGDAIAEIKVRNHWSKGIYTHEEEVILSCVTVGQK